jgi:phosphoribosylanthranilate isomerase
MKLKVCGMRDKANIEEVAALQPDFMGFIFYKKSPRYAGDALDIALAGALPSSIQKIGVFVNEERATVLEYMEKYQLQYVQLHGEESAAYCKALQEEGAKIIKAYAVDNRFDFQQLEEYVPYCEYFLFDTKTESYGGSGIAFDWQVLQKYHFSKPFFLGGGVGPANVAEAVAINHPAMFALDVNSRLEISPGLKNINSVALIKEAVQNK